MGKINVGQQNPKPLDMGGFTIAAETKTKQPSVNDEAKKEELRNKRLEEILSLPVEEQLPLLLDEGFDDEAKELSERLAAENENADKGDDDGTDGTDAENAVDAEEPEAPEPEVPSDGAEKAEDHEKQAPAKQNKPRGRRAGTSS